MEVLGLPFGVMLGVIVAEAWRQQAGSTLDLSNLGFEMPPGFAPPSCAPLRGLPNGTSCLCSLRVMDR